MALPDPAARGRWSHFTGYCHFQSITGDTMKFARILVLSLLALSVALPAFALVPRTIIAELGSATW